MLAEIEGQNCCRINGITENLLVVELGWNWRRLHLL
jgi:hypothetical protein